MRTRRGFSLVELLFALLVLTIVITTSLAVFTMRTRRLQQAAETIAVWQVLANESEVVRRVDYDALEALTPGFSTVPGTTLLEPIAPFETDVRVRIVRPNVKEVTLSVRWRGGQREQHLSLLRASTGGTNLW